jgi:hypothetical protein
VTSSSPGAEAIDEIEHELSCVLGRNSVDRETLEEVRTELSKVSDAIMELYFDSVRKGTG